MNCFDAIIEEYDEMIGFLLTHFRSRTISDKISFSLRRFIKRKSFDCDECVIRDRYSFEEIVLP